MKETKTIKNFNEMPTEKRYKLIQESLQRLKVKNKENEK